LQFIGRGKHVRKTEKEIIANTNLINVTADSLADMIYIVQYNLDELDRNVSQRFSDVETDIADLEDDFNRNRRKTSQTLFEIQQSITLLRTEKAEEINQSVKEKVGKLVEEKRVKFIPYDDPPKPLTSIKPKYPEIAQEAGIEGTVIVQVFVDKKGRVKETIILKGIPNTGLDEAAIKAIRKTRFLPAKQRERAVGVWISIPVNFRLKN
jgi:TonB family protein